MSFSTAKYLYKAPEMDVHHVRHLLLQTPTYFARFAWSLALSTRDLARAQRPTIHHVINFIVNTSLAIILRPHGDDGYELRYEGSRMRKRDDSRSLASLRVVFTMRDVETFELNGAALTDPEDMLNVLVVFLSCGTHTKSHVMGEKSVVEIREKGIAQLERSTWTTLSTDYAVLNSALSPIRSNLYGFHMDIDSLIDESHNASTIEHHVLRCRRPPPSQFLMFLMRSREALGRNLERHGIKVDREPLFNAMIVHPIDHYMAFKTLDGLRFSFHETKSDPMVFRAFMFRHLFLRGVLNPLVPNLIGTIDEPFYQDLYRDLVAIDAELADHVTACVMY